MNWCCNWLPSDVYLNGSIYRLGRMISHVRRSIISHWRLQPFSLCIPVSNSNSMLLLRVNTGVSVPYLMIGLISRCICARRRFHLTALVTHAAGEFTLVACDDSCLSALLSSLSSSSLSPSQTVESCSLPQVLYFGPNSFYSICRGCCCTNSLSRVRAFNKSETENCCCRCCTEEAVCSIM